MSKWIFTSIVALAVVIGLAVAVPSAIKKRHAREIMFEAARAALTAASYGPAEYDRRSVEMLLTMQNYGRVDEGFANSKAGSEMALFLLWLDTSRAAREKDRVRGIYSTELMALSEIELYPPSERDLAVARYDSVLFKHTTPWAYGSTVASAASVRAAGHLRNSMILAGDESGQLYLPPVPRKREEWLALLPADHPDRATKN